MVNERYYKTISYFFMMYGKEHEEERIKAYAQKLQDIPLDVLKSVLNKLVLTSKFVPSIAEIIEAGHSLLEEVKGEKTKTWAEAQKEIAQGLSRTWFVGCLGEVPFDHPDFGQPCEPMWSTPEIKAAVDSYGLDNLNRVMEDDMPTVWAQLRRAYDQACQRKNEKEIHQYVINKNPELIKLANQSESMLPWDDVERLQQLVGGIGLLKEGKS